VVAPEELGDADERLVGECPVLVGLDRGFARDEREDLAAAVVNPEKARRAVEADALEVIEQGPGGGLVGRQGRRTVCPTRLTSPALVSPPDRSTSPGSSNIGRYARCSSPLAIAVWVMRLVMKPPRIPAWTASTLAVP
jgi:hypothetical protein